WHTASLGWREGLIMQMPELLFALAILCIGSLGVPACAVYYSRWAQPSRPTVGLFQGSDLLALFIGIVVLPLIYLAMPTLVLSAITTLLLVNFLHQCLRCLFPSVLTWFLTLGLIATNILAVLAAHMGWQVGSSIHWVLNDLIVLLVAVSGSNLYAHWGMRM